MTRQISIPPPHVWERIEKILDEQDKARKETEKLISDTFRFRSVRRQNFFLALVTGVSLLALVIINYNVGLKQS
jgi:hypothetical protein